MGIFYFLRVRYRLRGGNLLLLQGKIQIAGWESSTVLPQRKIQIQDWGITYFIRGRYRYGSGEPVTSSADDTDNVREMNMERVGHLLHCQLEIYLERMGHLLVS